MYNRKLTIKETKETQLLGLRTVTRDVTEDTVVIAGLGVRRVTREREATEDKVKIGCLKFRRVNEDVNKQKLEVDWEFERECEEINWRWARSLDFHAPGLAAFQNYRARVDNREKDFRE